jgi:hypothetical protein
MFQYSLARRAGTVTEQQEAWRSQLTPQKRKSIKDALPRVLEAYCQHSAAPPQCTPEGKLFVLRRVEARGNGTFSLGARGGGGESGVRSKARSKLLGKLRGKLQWQNETAHGRPVGTAKQLEAAFIAMERSSMGEARKGAHVTSSKSSWERKTALVSALERDPVLAAVTAAWRRVFSIPLARA